MKGNDFESQIKEVEDHYKKYDEVWRMKPGERKKILEYLLCEYTATDICDAITGMFLSDFHQGRNKDQEVYIGFHYVFREHNFGRFRKLAHLANANAKIKSNRKAEQEETHRNRESDRVSMEKRHLNGFRYANRGASGSGGSDVIE